MPMWRKLESHPMHELEQLQQHPEKGYRFRKDLRPKVDTSANRHPTIKKQKPANLRKGKNLISRVTTLS